MRIVAVDVNLQFFVLTFKWPDAFAVDVSHLQYLQI